MRQMILSVALIAVVIAAPVRGAQVHTDPAIQHATRVLDLLEGGKFEKVAAEFNTKMAAAMPVPRLREWWGQVGLKVGARKSITRQHVVSQATGNTTVVNNCVFEKATLIIMVSFDHDGKIAGMNITPAGTPQ